MKQRKPKLIFVVSEDWFFCSHFIERAVAAKDTGYDVAVIAHENSDRANIERRGLRLIPYDLDRGSINVLKEIKTIWQILQIYRKEKPDIVHHVALKPVLYGSLAAVLCRIKGVVNAPVGMGHIFISNKLKIKILRFPILLLFKWLLNPKGSLVIFENSDDLHALIDGGFVKREKARLIRGAGVDLSQFEFASEPIGDPTTILVSRMLWDKGIGEYVAAARLVRQQGIKGRFLLVGGPDPHNRASIKEEQLLAWQKEGVVEWLGHRKDVTSLLVNSHIVCLPSYREGLPKALLEGLAAGKPIITTDVEGCREAVQNGKNGLLVPPRNAEALAKAMIEMISDPDKRRLMGQVGREMAEKYFAQGKIISQTLRVYQEMLLERGVD